MSAWKGVRARLRSFWAPSEAESRMESEFRFHVDMEVARLVQSGLSDAEARRRALVAFGGVDRHREAMRDGRGTRWLTDLRADLWYALRGMRRHRGFALATALTLGVGIGVNGVTFGFANSLLFRPLPVRDAQQLVGVFTQSTRTAVPDLLSYDDYVDLRDRSGVFDGVAGRTDGPVSLVIPSVPVPGAGSVASHAEMVWGEFVTENFFTVMQLEPVLGRFFDTSDGAPDAMQRAVLSHDAWRQRFNADSSIIGKVVRINGTPFTITAVAPPGFHGIRTFGFWPEVWVPVGMHRVVMPLQADPLHGRGDPWLMVVGRMHRGWSMRRTSAALTRFARQLATTYPGTNRETGMMLIPGAGGFDHPAFINPRVVQLAAGLGVFASVVTLLVICANLANLQLARAHARMREISIRLSLGCSRSRLMRQLLAESLVLATPGMALAGILVAASPRLETYLLPRLQFRVGFAPSVDVRVIGFTAAIAVLAIVLFGVLPLLLITRPDARATSAALSGSGTSGGWRSHRVRSSLVVTQLALSMVLLGAGTLFVRSLERARTADLGFEQDNRLVMSANLTLAGYNEARGRVAQREILSRVRAVPGVVDASWLYPVPFDTYDTRMPVYVDGFVGDQQDHSLTVDMSTGEGDFLRSLGLRLKSGRAFSTADSAGAPSVMIISRQLASRLWPGADPLGRQARLGGADGRLTQVVGVVDDARFALIGEADQMRVYVPLPQHYRGWETLVIHTRSDTRQVAQQFTREVTRQLRDAIAAVDPDLPTFGTMTMRESVASGTSIMLSAAAIGSFFGALALLLATIGLYAVVAGTVASRTREIGIRVALGATPRGIMTFIMRGGATLGLLGLSIGLAGSYLVSLSMRGLLYGLSATDPLTMASVSAVLGFVVVVATWVPARQALRLNTVTALRQD